SGTKNLCKNARASASIGEVMSFNPALIFLLLLALAAPVSSWGRGEQAVSRGQKAGAQAKLAFEKDIQPLLSQYCYGCHGNGKKKGDVALDAYKNEASVTKDQAVWEK